MQALGLVWGEVDSCAPDFQERFTILDAPKHSGAELLHSLWQRKRAEGGFVVGRDIPSRELSSVLRNLAVYEAIERGMDFRVRIAGTAFYRRFGEDVTGKRLSELFDARMFKAIRARLNSTLASARPTSVEIERMQGGNSGNFEILMLPVSAPSRTAHWVLVGMFFQDWVR